jgi:hypothetical protein
MCDLKDNLSKRGRKGGGKSGGSGKGKKSPALRHPGLESRLFKNRKGSFFEPAGQVPNACYSCFGRKGSQFSLAAGKRLIRPHLVTIRPTTLLVENSFLPVSIEVKNPNSPENTNFNHQLSKRIPVTHPFIPGIQHGPYQNRKLGKSFKNLK